MTWEKDKGLHCYMKLSRNDKYNYTKIKRFVSFKLISTVYISVQDKGSK